MNYYIVNRNEQSTGEHEVHVHNCSQGPNPSNAIDLGWFNTCREAIVAAKKYFNDVDGCAYCCSACHRK